ncbi:MAG: hypothetical protein ABDI07_04045 [Candidatus Kryptonium sp.]
MRKLLFTITFFIFFISLLISQDLERAVKRMTQPEVMVVIDEIVDGNFTGTRTISAAIENELLKEGFKIIDYQIFSNIRASELQQAQGNPEKAREYENRFGAEIIILGYATAEYGGESEFYDVKQHKYTGQVDIKVIYTDTGELIASITASDRKFAQDKRGAVNSLFRSLASKVSKNVVSKIKERLKEEEQVKKIEIAIYAYPKTELFKLNPNFKNLFHRSKL